MQPSQSDKAFITGHYVEAIEVDFGTYTDSIDNRHIYGVTATGSRVTVTFTDHIMIIEGKNLLKLGSDIRRKVLPRIVVLSDLTKEKADALPFYVDNVEFKEKQPEK